MTSRKPGSTYRGASGAHSRTFGDDGTRGAIEETFRTPERVLESLFDSEARLYYRFYRETTVGAKYLCVVVKITQGDAFVLTAYLTDSVKRGWRLWPETE